ncbi:MAG: YabP/YqfC family sporulation protein [Eubacteriales bacterium]|nr:YabP/YqfC family sporulation protein [Eubacteriales bacterium]MDD4389930.1 YabP/YqfC family sporulation protein [Eubacteriales bacterium]
MGFSDDFLYDFSFSLPRILVSGKTCILDNIKRIVMLSEKEIIIYNGQRYTAVSGNELSIREINDERMLVQGEIEKIEFFGTQMQDKD